MQLRHSAFSPRTRSIFLASNHFNSSRLSPSQGYKYALLIPMIGDQLIGFAGPLVEQGTCIIKVGMIGLKEGWLVAVAGVEAEGGMVEGMEGSTEFMTAGASHLACLHC